jgi:hypothetical protein
MGLVGVITWILPEPEAIIGKTHTFFIQYSGIIMMEEHHGYSDTKNLLYVVYNHKRRLAGSVGDHVYTGTGFGLPYAKQMVPHLPRNLQCGYLLVSRVV